LTVPEIEMVKLPGGVESQVAASGRNTRNAFPRGKLQERSFPELERDASNASGSYVVKAVSSILRLAICVGLSFERASLALQFGIALYSL
jgi:hypothetical protein